MLRIGHRPKLQAPVEEAASSLSCASHTICRTFSSKLETAPSLGMQNALLLTASKQSQKTFVSFSLTRETSLKPAACSQPASHIDAAAAAAAASNGATQQACNLPWSNAAPVHIHKAMHFSRYPLSAQPGLQACHLKGEGLYLRLHPKGSQRVL